MSSGVDLIWYRFRATLKRRLGGYLALAIFVGLIGGIAFGSLVGARRTESSYPQYLTSTNPSDLLVQPTTSINCADPFVAAIGRLRDVSQVRCALALEAETLDANGSIGTILLTQVELVASSQGLFSSQDKVTVIDGRAADPARVNEVVASPAAASLFHLHVGSRLLVGIDRYTEPPLGKPLRSLDLTVVGIGVFNNQIVQDDVDRGHTGFFLGTPALARQFSACCTSVTYDGVQLTNGGRDDGVFESEYSALVQKTFKVAHAQFQIYATSVIEADAQRAIRPETIALATFGGIAAIAALVVGAQVISRRLREQIEDADVLWALGAGPALSAADGFSGLVLSSAVGSVAAAALAVALSPLAVFGPARAVDPAPGFDFDWTVIGFGMAAFTLVLSAVAVVTAYRLVPRGTTRRRITTERRSAVVRAALGAGVPPSAAVGLHFALQSGRGRSATPVRSAIIGGVLAIGVVMATLTFGDSLNTLASHPALYGWNFDAALFSTDGYGPIPSVVVDPLLAHDPQVASATGVYFATVEIGGAAVPAIIAAASGPWAPPVLSGHAIEGSHQIVLGTATLAALHKRIGDTVTVQGPDLTLHLRIVGTASLPTIGTTLGLHASIATGAVFSTALIPSALIDTSGPFSGPNAIFVRFRSGVGEVAGDQTLDHVAAELTAVSRSPRIVAESSGDSAGLVFEVLGPQRPAEIVNYRSMGATPGVLAAGLAVGAVAALGLTLIASVRRRRRELALLKTIGFTRRQLLVAVAWQATVVAALSLVIGTPLGIAFGRLLWLLFAHQLSAVADPAVPVVSVAAVVLGTLLIANLVAAVPGRIAAETPTALLLRAE